MLLIIVPAVCEQSSSIFGDSSTCSTYGEAYAAVSTGVGTVFIWTYLFIVMEESTDNKSIENEDISETTASAIYSAGTLERSSPNITEPLLTSTESVTIIESSFDSNRRKMPMLEYITSPIIKCMRYVKLETLFTPSTIAVIIGFAIGSISPIQKLMVGNSAPFRVLLTSASLVGYAFFISSG
ncbi:hypothetical protein VNO78_26916 [Psophocarpus tetragonolobus]|uniref:PIN-like protein n=1 Tax=Psophocarpus tetragonolobus TaxID=3891 RepID=A0AAN9S1H1_PSOTE